eukprot:GHVR01059628.1.p1 GENE.GHVR01059628.1~~GHVR01059628.1.p1  ORF type:complete len:484 (-),score=111.38 GHVR01059628.1:87-1538(-)
MSTPAGSCVIREREGGVAYGGILLTASHNPGGIDNDFGVKYNMENGEPAPEAVTESIYKNTTNITRIKYCTLPSLDIDTLGVCSMLGGEFIVEVISPTQDYIIMMKNIFNFDLIKSFVSSSNFTMLFDGLHGVAGPYAKHLLGVELGVSDDALVNCIPKEDFGGGHPDPNLTYAKDLVDRLCVTSPGQVTGATPDFGAASDGDADRLMVLGKGFFVTPSDSVAVIAAQVSECVPFFKGGLKGVARSMPTSMALDRVADSLGLKCYETPTGWKFFGNLMDDGKLSVCGEESFGTGSDHIREKDGLWAVMAWLSILAYKNKDSTSFVSVKDIVVDHWKKFGRNYYTRYDYEEVEVDAANTLISRLEGFISDIDSVAKQCTSISEQLRENPLVKADNFSYTDPVDGSVSANQGLRFFFKDGSRIVWRLSGTGSAGATIRVYVEMPTQDSNKLMEDTADTLKTLIDVALVICDVKNITGRDKPSVIT